MAGRPSGLPKTGGRQKGTPNKDVANIRQMIEDALEMAGGAEYLRRQSGENPAAFMSLVGRILPKETTISGPDGGPVQHSINVKFE